MPYPALKVDMKKLESNARFLIQECNKFGINPMAVTKGFSAIPEVAQILVNAGINTLADARILNLKKLRHIECTKVLLRIPMLSELKDVVEFSDISLNSEIKTIREIGKLSVQMGKKHKVILMIDVGDLREGVWPDNALEYIDQIIQIDGVELVGVGTNVTCYGAVLPTYENLSILSEIYQNVKKQYNIKLDIISGGNSSSILLMKSGKMPKEINNLRLGEVLLLGRETQDGTIIDSLYDDAFILQAEIIEIKEKPSVPIGIIGVDGFGSKPNFDDRGIRKRAIVALGRQDIKVNTYQPLDPGLDILGSSSDHTVLDITDGSHAYDLGDIIEFSINYEALLSVCTSEYVRKYIV